MKMRAERIGATLTFESTPSGLTIHVKGKGI
jgi:signal transduction histidine kinase